ncbi:MAG: pentapeptide repeat-containing protein [Jaaginema sp. PMC 1079.18]|nr:pentapeptide repeat-containing protein [Jaaginema sp. PMC 1080.18]MEC4853459.1 pentapeptide repeat-containing protein [Jaaginema sp. PMC 1079.18]MEC4867811.1 pentapeptide repeat-containing protein [Jaaginema sp. PMC 1078.18]
MKFWQRFSISIVVLISFTLALPSIAQAASSAAIRAYDDIVVTSKNFADQDLRAAEFAEVKLINADFSNANMQGAVFNNVDLTNANWENADFSDGIAYLAQFVNTNLHNAILTETMLLRSTFKNVDITGADFSFAVLDGVQRKNLCEVATGTNPVTGMDTRESLECNS